MQSSISYDKLHNNSGVSLCKVVGEGGSALVYSGTYYGREVAVKLPKLAGSIEREIECEAGFLTKLRHPNITTCFGVVRFDQCVGLVLELARTTLSQRLKSPETSLKQKFSYARDICAGFAYLHTIGVIHRDLHVGNILITADEHAKLCDFASSYLHRGDEISRRYAFIDRLRLGFVFHAIYCSEVYDSDVLGQLISRIEDIKITSIGEADPVQYARDLCWKSEDRETREFIRQLCVAFIVRDSLLQRFKLWQTG